MPDLRDLIINAQRTGAICDELGTHLMRIARTVCRTPRWRGYSMIDEWEADMVVDLIKAVPKVDCTRTTKPETYLQRSVENRLRNKLRAAHNFSTASATTNALTDAKLVAPEDPPVTPRTDASKYVHITNKQKLHEVQRGRIGLFRDATTGHVLVVMHFEDWLDAEE